MAVRDRRTAVHATLLRTRVDGERSVRARRDAWWAAARTTVSETRTAGRHAGLAEAGRWACRVRASALSHDGGHDTRGAASLSRGVIRTRPRSGPRPPAVPRVPAL